MTTPTDITTRAGARRRQPIQDSPGLALLAAVIPFPARPNPDPDPLIA